MTVELYKFSQENKRKPFAKNQKLFFSIDWSRVHIDNPAYEGIRKADFIRDELHDLLDQILVLKVEANVQVDVGFLIAGYPTNFSSSSFFFEDDIDASKITSLKNQIDIFTSLSLVLPTSAYPRYAMQKAIEYFLRPEVGEFEKSFFYMLGSNYEDNPNPEGKAGYDTSLLESYFDTLENETFFYKDFYEKQGGFDVNIYAIGIDEVEHDYLKIYENTNGVLTWNTEKQGNLLKIFENVIYKENEFFNTTSANKETFFKTSVFEKTPLQRNSLKVKSQLSKSNLEITVPVRNFNFRKWLQENLESVVNLTIYTYRSRIDFDIFFKGRLISMQPDGFNLKLTFEPVFTSLARPGLKKAFQRSCPYSIYGTGCELNKNNFQASLLVSAIVENDVTCAGATAYPNGYFDSGVLEDENGNTKFITKHVGSKLTLASRMPTLELLWANDNASRIKIAPGCDKSAQTCKDRFNNLENHGGFPFMPLKNPFGGTSIV